jgi:hypothetical protein
MAGNFFDDLMIILPTFFAIICVIATSLSIYYFPNLTIIATIANAAVGIYFVIRGYTSSDENNKSDINFTKTVDYYRVVGWILIFSAAALGLKHLFIGNKVIPKYNSTYQRNRIII